MLTRSLSSFPSGRQSLTILAVLFTLLAGFCWWHWSAFLAWNLTTQITLHRYLVLHLLQINNGQYGGGLWLLFFTFIYGVLHAVGPGHGKFVVTTWLSTQQAPSSGALRAVPLAGSLLQGASAILFVFILAVGFNLVAGDLSLSRWYLEKASALLIAAFGFWLLLRGLRAFRSSAKHVHHHDACGCGHHHIATSQPADWKERLSVIAAIGLRPCSGAITVLLFSNAIGIVSWGMLAVMTMALGTGLSLLLLSLAVNRMRDTVTAIWLRDTPARLDGLVALARVAGGLLLLFFALVLFLSVVPVSPNGDFIAAGC